MTILLNFNLNFLQVLSVDFLTADQRQDESFMGQVHPFELQLDQDIMKHNKLPVALLSLDSRIHIFDIHCLAQHMVNNL